ncbi:cleavage and polyadenylation specificity factor subunit 1-like [Echeneis naucrates]|uniref:cleavage and polyadenylation specificity factor subunit 1-like n=1 Tax=Echeneis naucrates TaxID=173247 RepID=UPI001113E2D9|nr:cleavage and polyadenylation specificity factor subunit 1-like [Echeneis naucrates]
MTGEEKEYEVIDRDERYINPQQEKFSIQLISPVSWEAIPNTRPQIHSCCLFVSTRGKCLLLGSLQAAPMSHTIF